MVTGDHLRDVVLRVGRYPERLSAAERDRALKVLRDGVVTGRLPNDTFIRRMEVRAARGPARSGETDWGTRAAVPMHRS